MSVNKVIVNTENGYETLIDLTNDTVASETLAEGVTAHDASGAVIAGSMPITNVLYTPQALTDEQKEQARKNIGVENCALQKLDVTDIDIGTMNQGNYICGVDSAYYHLDNLYDMVTGEPIEVNGTCSYGDKISVYKDTNTGTDYISSINHYTIISATQSREIQISDTIDYLQLDKDTTTNFGGNPNALTSNALKFLDTMSSYDVLESLADGSYWVCGENSQLSCTFGDLYDGSVISEEPWVENYLTLPQNTIVFVNSLSYMSNSTFYNIIFPDGSKMTLTKSDDGYGNISYSETKHSGHSGNSEPVESVSLVDAETSKTYSLYVSNGKLMLSKEE